MKLSKRTFRILFPSIYLVLTLLPIVGVIITIAEGPTPFGFLLSASAPAFLLLDFIELRLGHLPVLNFWFEMLIVVLLNIGFYFLVGWALDAIINRFRRRHSDVRACLVFAIAALSMSILNQPATAPAQQVERRSVTEAFSRNPNNPRRYINVGQSFPQFRPTPPVNAK